MRVEINAENGLSSRDQIKTRNGHVIIRSQEKMIKIRDPFSIGYSLRKSCLLQIIVSLYMHSMSSNITLWTESCMLQQLYIKFLALEMF